MIPEYIRKEYLTNAVFHQVANALANIIESHQLSEESARHAVDVAIELVRENEWRNKSPLSSEG